MAVVNGAEMLLLPLPMEEVGSKEPCLWEALLTD